MPLWRCRRNIFFHLARAITNVLAHALVASNLFGVSVVWSRQNEPLMAQAGYSPFDAIGTHIDWIDLGRVHVAS